MPHTYAIALTTENLDLVTKLNDGVVPLQKDEDYFICTPLSNISSTIVTRIEVAALDRDANVSLTIIP